MNPPGATAGRIRYLDGLRGIALLLVLVHHFVVPLFGGALASPGAYIAAALGLTFTGVDLFFVLSGFLIGGILLDHRQSPRLMPTFYIRRALRILPLGIAIIVLILAADRAGLYAEPPQGGDPFPMPVYLFFGSNLGMAIANDWSYRPLACLWSLAIEEQFYLVAPWLVRAVRLARLPHLLAGFAVFSFGFRLLWIAFRPEETLTASLLTLGRMDGLGLGMLVAWLVRQPATVAWCRQRRSLLFGALAVGGIGLLGLLKLHARNGGLPMVVGGYTLIAVCYALGLLLLEVGAADRLRTWLATPALVTVGRRSYFLYLFQGLGIQVTVGLVFHHRLLLADPANTFQTAVGFTGLFLAAQLSWRWFEAPLIGLGRRLAY